MKKWLPIVSFFLFLSGFERIYPQETSIGDDIKNINTLLKENPYKDTFLEITFFYSIDITENKDLIVYMDFDGPFRTMTKVNVLKLKQPVQIDTALEGTSSICWTCQPDSTSKPCSCVYYESITSDGEKDSHYTENICVMISRKSGIRGKLVRCFEELFRKLLEQ